MKRREFITLIGGAALPDRWLAPTNDRLNDRIPRLLRCMSLVVPRSVFRRGDDLD